MIRLFGPGELDRGTAALFEMAAQGSLAGAVPAPRQPGRQAARERDRPRGAPAPGSARRISRARAAKPPGALADGDSPGAATGGSLLDRLDPEQRAAAAAAAPLMIIAGPGTGKTRTLTHRIAAAVAEQGVPAEACLALTFTRRAAEEMRERLAALLGRRAARLTVTTFHGLGLMILREHHELAGLAADFTVADEKAVLEVATELAGSPRGGRALLAGAAADPQRRELLRQGLAARDLVDFDGLVELAVEVLDADAGGGRRAPRALAADQRGRVPGHRRGAVRAAAAAGRGRDRAHRDRRPGPGHLPLPRRGRGLLPAVRAGLPRRRARRR